MDSNDYDYKFKCKCGETITVNVNLWSDGYGSGLNGVSVKHDEDDLKECLEEKKLPPKKKKSIWDIYLGK